MSTTKESFGSVLRKRRTIIVSLAVVLLILTGASFLLEYANKGKKNIHVDLPPSDLGLKPIEILSDSTEGTLGTVLTETTAVTMDYFTDALFVGDSLTEGIRIYDVFAGFTALSKRGISPQSATTDGQFCTINGQQMTMVDAIEYYKPRKVYVMLGTNGFEYYSLDELVAGFEAFIDAVQTRVPGCSIVVQSIPPTTQATSVSRPAYSPQNIDTYNDMVRLLAMKKGVYYLDVHSVLSGADGFLPVEIAAPDGIHLQPSGYEIWKQYLFTHAIQGESAFSINAEGLIQFVSVG